MAVKKTVENEINVLDFFSKDNEEKGMWFEATIKGEPTGIEFKIFGPNSNQVWKLNNEYSKSLKELDNIQDDEERKVRSDKLLVDMMTGRVCDIRGKDGAVLKINDKEVTKDDVRTIFENAPSIVYSVWEIAQNEDNFLGKRKKN